MSLMIFDGMPSVIMLSVIVVNVVAPTKVLPHQKMKKKSFKCDKK
jgi:hypothetical protein